MRRILLSLQPPEALALKRYVLFGLLVFVLCTPLLFVAFLLAAAQFPALDRVTMSMPSSFRSAVASIAIRKARSEGGRASKVERALRLDPKAADLWADECAVGASNCPSGASAFTSSAEWTRRGELKEKAGDFCGAEKDYAAASRMITGYDTGNSRALGRTLLHCGQTGLAITEFNVALHQDTLVRDRQQHTSSGDDAPDERTEAAANVITDEEWLSIAYRVQNRNQSGAAEEACHAAHPELHPCYCTLTKGKLSCSSGVPPQVR